MQKLFLAALALGAAFALQAQNSNTIVADNLGQIMSAKTVGNNTLQIEGGYSYYNRSYDFTGYNNGSSRNYTNSGNFNLRYGFLHRMEISAGYTGAFYNIRTQFDTLDPRIFDGYESTYHFQLKGNILKGNGLSPSLAASVSYDNFEYSENIWFNVALGSELTKKLSARVELGYLYENTFEFGLHLDYEITPNVLVFAEYFQRSTYSQFIDGGFNRPNLNLGLGYNLSKNTQLNVFGTCYLPYSAGLSPELFGEYSINVNFATRISWGKDTH